MYKKILLSDHFIKPNKKNFRWLFAKRLNVEFNDEKLSFDKNNIPFIEIEDVFVIEYKTLFLFKSYILGFKLKNRFYQLGINKIEKNLILKYFKINISKLNSSIWDIVYILFIAILIYLGFIV